MGNYYGTKTVDLKGNRAQKMTKRKLDPKELQTDVADIGVELQYRDRCRSSLIVGLVLGEGAGRSDSKI